MRNPFKLEKLKIRVVEQAYKAVSGITKFVAVSGSEYTFEVMFNPESFSISYENVYTKPQGINTSSKDGTYSLSKPEELSLKLIFDDTGVVSPSSIAGAVVPGLDAKINSIRGKSDVYKQVHRFLDICYEIKSDTHQPNKLELLWGDLIFQCHLKSVDIQYTLFNRGGQPIRAELDTMFEGDIKDSARIKKENKNSPDLTHVRTVGSSDTLPLMASAIYQTPAYYIQLARANKLNNFRKLKTGSSISFPPVRSAVQ